MPKENACPPFCPSREVGVKKEGVAEARGERKLGAGGMDTLCLWQKHRGERLMGSEPGWITKGPRDCVGFILRTVGSPWVVLRRDYAFYNSGSYLRLSHWVGRPAGCCWHVLDEVMETREWP